MKFKVNGEERELNFGVRFVADIDESEQFETDGFEFGMGLMMAQQKLAMGKYDSLAKIIKYALRKENFTLDEIFEAIDQYAEENDLEVLISKIEEELKNSNAVRTMQARMEKRTKEANRKQAAKPTKK